jgi:hypothetical protein
VSNRDRLKLTPDLTTRDLWRSRRWARERGNENFVYSSLWDFKSSLTRRKILRHGTFPLYFPSERKVYCGILSPLKIHRLGRVLNKQPLGPVASTLTTTPPRRQNAIINLLKTWLVHWIHGSLWSVIRLHRYSLNILTIMKSSNLLHVPPGFSDFLLLL